MKSTESKFQALARRMQFFPPGIWVIALAICLVGGRLLWIQLHLPAHRQEIIAALGSLNYFYEGAQMNRDGSRFIYVADGRIGRSVYLCDTATGRRQVVCEGTGKGEAHSLFNLHVWPWAPDDSAFIYVNADDLVVCPADTNQAPVSLSFDGTNVISDVVWLNPAEFAFVANHNSLCLGQRQPDGRWELHQFPCGYDLPNLTAVGDHEVAWLQNDFIYRIKLPGDGTTNPFTQMANTPPPASPLTNGIALWLDASRLRQPDQAAVMELPDLSRRRNDAEWNGTPPVFNGTNSPGALDGQGTIHFSWLDSATNGTGLKTRGPIGITGATPRSVFVVRRHEADRPMMVSMGDTSAHGALFGVEWSEHLFLPTGWWADNYVDATSTNWNLLEVVYNGATQKGYLNGLLRCTASATLNTVERGVEIGFRDGQDAKAAEGDFAELLVYDRALSGPERQQVEDYLSAKWFGVRTLSASSSFIWLDPQMDGIVSFNYSRETGRFLLVCSQNGQNTLWRFDSQGDQLDGSAKVLTAGSIQSVQWIGKDDFAYTGSDPGHQGCFLADVSGAEKVRLFEHGRIDWNGAAPDGSKLLILGTVTNEPFSGIWQYDLASRKLRPVAPYSDHPSDLIKRLDSTVEKITLPSGRVVDCTIFPPANFNPHKKYPLLIAESPWRVNEWLVPETCGAYVAVTTRAGWWEGMDQINENILGAYNHMIQKPNIDVRRVYACVVSAETRYFNQMLTNTPGLWKGVIMLQGTDYPDFSSVPPFQSKPRIMITAGGRELKEDRLKKYQQDALSHGVVVEYFIHPDDAHVIIGNGSRMDRAKESMHFIFEE